MMDGPDSGVGLEAERAPHRRRMDLGQAAKNAMEMQAHSEYAGVLIESGTRVRGELPHQMIWMAQLCHGCEGARAACKQVCKTECVDTVNRELGLDPSASVDLTKAAHHAAQIHPYHPEYVFLGREFGVVGLDYARFIWLAQLKYGAEGAAVARSIIASGLGLPVCN